jgi:periplasmic divalent cation tolerance protein
VKTTAARFAALRDRIVAAHPYELPEVIAVDVAAGLPAYLDWVAAGTR